MMQKFDLSAYGLPDTALNMRAVGIAMNWLHDHDTDNDVALLDMIEKTSISSAKLLLEHCPDVTDEAIAVALLGQGRAVFLKSAQDMQDCYDMMGRNVALILLAIDNPDNASGTLKRDALRVRVAEEISLLQRTILGLDNIMPVFYALCAEKLKTARVVSSLCDARDADLHAALVESIYAAEKKLAPLAPKRPPTGGFRPGV